MRFKTSLHWRFVSDILVFKRCDRRLRVLISELRGLGWLWLWCKACYCFKFNPRLIELPLLSRDLLIRVKILNCFLFLQYFFISLGLHFLYLLLMIFTFFGLYVFGCFYKQIQDLLWLSLKLQIFLFKRILEHIRFLKGFLRLRYSGYRVIKDLLKVWVYRDIIN